MKNRPLKDVLDPEEEMEVIELEYGQVLKYSILSRMDYLSGHSSKDQHEWSIEHAKYLNGILIKLGGDSYDVEKYK